MNGNRIEEGAEYEDDQALEGDSSPSADREELLLPYPYVRFFARMIDVLIYANLYIGFCLVSGIGFSRELLPGSYLSLLTFCVPMVLIEALWVWLLGTTPGKAMLGIIVRDYRGQRLSLPLSLLRATMVMLLGTGCYFFLLMLVALFFSWWWVHRAGFTPWDRRLGTCDFLIHPLTPQKMLMSLVLILLCFQILYTLVCMWTAG